MPVTKNAALRYRVIDEKLRNTMRMYPSLEDLRSACEEKLFGSEWNEHVSTSSIEKDLKFMRNEFDAPIKYHKTEKGYYYEDSHFSLDKIPLSEEEKSALKFASATLNQYAHFGVFKLFKNAIQKIFEQTAVNMDGEDDSFIFFENTGVEKGSEWLQVISDAIREKVEMKLSYFSFHSQSLKQFVIHPYVLKEYKGLWYMVGFEITRNKVLTLELSRIEHINTLPTTFEIKGFSVKDYFQNSPGISVNEGQVEEVIIEVKKDIWPFVKRIPIHPQQKKVNETDKTVELKFTSYLAPELIHEILSHGSGVKVLKPKSLREEIQNELQAAFKSYS